MTIKVEYSQAKGLIQTGVAAGEEAFSVSGAPVVGHQEDVTSSSSVKIVTVAHDDDGDVNAGTNIDLGGKVFYLYDADGTKFGLWFDVAGGDAYPGVADGVVVANQIELINTAAQLNSATKVSTCLRDRINHANADDNGVDYSGAADTLSARFVASLDGADLVVTAKKMGRPYLGLVDLGTFVGMSQRDGDPLSFTSTLTSGTGSYHLTGHGATTLNKPGLSTSEVWIKDDTQTGVKKTVVLSSTNGGGTTVNIKNSDGTTSFGVVSAAGDYVHLIWTESKWQLVASEVD